VAVATVVAVAVVVEATVVVVAGVGVAAVAFHFPLVGPAEFFDSLGNVPETYHRRFADVLIVNIYFTSINTHTVFYADLFIYLFHLKYHTDQTEFLYL